MRSAVAILGNGSGQGVALFCVLGNRTQLATRNRSALCGPRHSKFVALDPQGGNQLCTVGHGFAVLCLQRIQSLRSGCGAQVAKLYCVGIRIYIEQHGIRTVFEAIGYGIAVRCRNDYIIDQQGEILPVDADGAADENVGICCAGRNGVAVFCPFIIIGRIVHWVGCTGVYIALIQVSRQTNSPPVIICIRNIRLICLKGNGCACRVSLLGDQGHRCCFSDLVKMQFKQIAFRRHDLQIFLIFYIFYVSQCFLIIAVHGLHKRLQAIGVSGLIILPENVVHRAVGHGQCPIVDRKDNILIQSLRMDIADLYIVQAVLCHRHTSMLAHFEGIVCNIPATCEIETNCRFVLEQQGCTVQADPCQRTIHFDLRYFGRYSSRIHRDAAVCQRTGVVMKIGLCCGAIVQHLLNHGLNFVIVAAIQNGIGIAANRIFAGMHHFFSAFYSQNDGIIHLCCCNIYSYNITGDGRCNPHTVNRNGNSVVRAAEMEFHTDIVTQCDIPAFQCTRFTGGKYGCRQQRQNHYKCQQQGKYAVCRFLHNCLASSQNKFKQNWNFCNSLFRFWDGGDGLQAIPSPIIHP